MKRVKTALAGMVVSAAVFGFGVLGTAVAAPMLVTDVGSNVVGISDLNIGGTSYDVTFADAVAASYNDTIAVHGTGHVFADSTEAAVAETALVNFLNSEAVSSVLSSAATQIWFRVGPLTPHLDLFAINYSNGSSAWIDNPFLSTGFSTEIPFGQESPSDPAHAWAIFSENSAAVPAPGTLLLFGFGMAGMFVARRRIR